MSQLPYWLAAIRFSPRKIFHWLTLFPSIQQLFQATESELKANNIAPSDIQSILNPDWQNVERSLHWAEQSHHSIVTYDDPAYPALLKEIHTPPILLFVKGNKSAISKIQIAMVGARNATYAGLKNAENFARQLAAQGLVITSGLARGIDFSSHQGALAVQGITIGVAGTGLNHIYPKEHHQLAADIVNHDGALLSEFPLDTPPRAPHFPQRNRLISGLSAGVLLVEAALKSGSLITARHALEQGREVFAIPGSIHHPLSKGCHHLIRQGAKLVETADDILEELGSLCAFQVKNNINQIIKQTMTHLEQQIFSQITHDITPIDVIILRSGLTTSEVSSILLTLELDGHIQSVTGGYVRTIANQ